MRPARLLRVAGYATSAIALAAAGFLTAEHLFGASLPGCGPQSDCAALSRGPWGTIPRLGWPLSIVGFAYAAGAIVSWWIGGMRQWRPSRLVVLPGASASVIFLCVMAVEQAFCPWCAAFHLGNLAFTVCVFAAALRRRHGGLVPAAAWIATSAVALASLLPLESRRAESEQFAAETAAAESTREIVEAAPQERTPFTGRWLRGPQRAAIRIVVLSDYQCPDCRRVEEELEQLVATRDDVSLSMKHFPMCADCNRHAPRTLHPNACWAARAAEAAGILHGAAGFWEMHDWLFERKGSFTDAELRAALPALGYTVEEFLALLQSERTLEPVQSDIEEGMRLGLMFTPMVFINGVEMKGWQIPGAVTRAVETVATTNPQPLTADEAPDAPASAEEKYVQDWRDAAHIPAPRDDRPHALGPVGAAMHIIVWGDVRISATHAVDAEIRRWIAAGDPVRYEFRHYPASRQCNPKVQIDRGPDSCLAARALEAAGAIGGEEAFWKMHAWLLARVERPFDASSLPAAANEIGVAPAELAARLNDPEITKAIEADCLVTTPFGARAVPFVWINGHAVPRLYLGSDLRLGLIRDAIQNEIHDAAPSGGDASAARE